MAKIEVFTYNIQVKLGDDPVEKWSVFVAEFLNSDVWSVCFIGRL